MEQKIFDSIQDSIVTKQTILANPKMLELIAHTSQAIATAFTNGNRVYFCGNGGSAADAQHLAAELSGPFYNRNRPSLPADALHCNTSYLTAVANDFSYDEVYAHLVKSQLKAGDVIIGLTTSGNSPNIVNALKAATAKNALTIGMTGSKPGQIDAYSTILFKVPSEQTPRIQEAHMLIGHIICELVEASLFPQ